MLTVRRIAAAAAVLIALLVPAAPAAALEPPLPGALAEYRADGSLAWRQVRARALGNEHIVTGMLPAAVRRLRQAQLGLPQLRTPPPAWKGMPTMGTINILAVPICFSDYPPYTSQTELQDRLFGDGEPGDHPYESLHNYYDRSSYGQLDIQGDVLPWYDTGRPRARNPADGHQETLIKEALDAYAAAHPGWDAAKYDNDGDGRIDYAVVIWTGPHTGWGGFWWGYQTYFQDSRYEVGGAGLNMYSWQWEYQYGAGPRPAVRPYSPLVTIHETGHALGLPDYYDYEPGWGPDGGVGGLDMMDNNWGDHNVFSKWLLDWLTPQIMASGHGPVALAASGTSPEALAIMPGMRSDGHPGPQFQEYFLVENRYRVGNNTGQNQPRQYPQADGLLVWHVDARLNVGTGDYRYDNSYTPHKLLRLMEADGREQIERGEWADAGDFYRAGTPALHPLTTPSSFAYGSKTRGVLLRDFSGPGPVMTLWASTDWAPPVTSVRSAPVPWSRRAVTLTFDPTDAGSGVASTTYRVGAGPWTPGRQLTLPADRATHEHDGVYVVRYRSVDNAGNVEPVRRLTIRIDTLGPRCRAPRAASVRRGRPATLVYSVADRLSPRAHVVIRIRRADGRIVRTLKANGVKTGVRHRRSFVCRLARGRYRVDVRARDLAGNLQTVRGSNTLRVR